MPERRPPPSRSRTSVRRPAQARRPVRRPAPASRRSSARARAAKRRHPSAGGRWSGTVWLTIGVLLFVGLLFVFVFPTQTFLTQRREVNEVSDRLAVLKHQNHALEKQAAALQSDAEVERLARERFGLVQPGEEGVVVVPPAEQVTEVPPPTTAPTTEPPATTVP